MSRNPTKTTLINDQFMVQKANIDDLAQIIAIYNQSIAGKRATANWFPVTLAERQAWFDEHLHNPKRPIYVVKSVIKKAVKAASSAQPEGLPQPNSELASQGSPLVAWGSFSDLYARPAYHISSEISIYLHEKYQGQGIGVALVRWMLTQAPSLDIHNVVALIFAHNQPSLKLFTKFGFTQWGYLPQVCDMQGFTADVVMLGKAITLDEKNEQ